MSSSISCPTCGASVPQRKFCAECGSNLPEVPTVSQREPRPSAGIADYGAALAKVPGRTRKVPACRNCGELGWERAKREFIVPTAGNRSEELAARFVQRIEERGIPGLEITRAAVDIATGLHICVTKRLKCREEASMLVQFQQQGTDAILGWRHYELPGNGVDSYLHSNLSGKLMIALDHLRDLILYAISFGSGGFLATLILMGILGGTKLISESAKEHFLLILISGIAISILFGAIFWFFHSFSMRDDDYLFSMSQSESSSLKLSVRAALDEAIDDANLSGLVQEIGSTDKKVI
jgi:hypothetical protein